MTDPTEAGLREIAALRRRLADLETLARQQAPPPGDKPAGFGDAFRQLARDGSASGPGIDRLRAAVAGGSTAPEAPDPATLAAATRSAVDFGARPTIEEAFTAMRSRAARVDVVETVSPGGLGRIDPLNQASASTIDKIRRLLEQEHD